jgi:hypothetical protein
VILEEIDQRRAVRLDEIGRDRPRHGLRRADGVRLGEQDPVFAAFDQRPVEFRHDRDEVDLVLVDHRRHVGKIGLHGGEVAVLHAVAVQHDAHRHVVRRADRVRRHALALQILDGLDRPVGPHDIGHAEMAVGAVLQAIGDDAQVEMRVDDGERQRRGRKGGDLELARRHALNLWRAAGEAQTLGGIALAEMPEQLGMALLQLVDQRLDVARRRRPADMNGNRLGRGRAPGDSRDASQRRGVSPEFHRRSAICRRCGAWLP